ncbi:hypothetical protein MAPG_10658 [Magnaporthiopsis poae ATCC 64411]|uniref:Aminoglycoside phosphotransferase domain-containing protein n=1 Tax=Magnaporthiopsis poae (strain ATCC 64411 / 73-15) TaxID=644358 RepID=A0A0C4ED65_MAGP6|nr:hypothetical protein MAPG_10658 [Magnaporthiopsis poae ATCC 64411]
MYDEIIEDGIRKERERYIESIKDRICFLASAHHGGDDCEFFQDLKKGSYNVCFFVRFFRRPRPAREPDAAPDGDRWVVRVPLAPCLAIEPWEKVATEIATMQFVASHTTIPVPKVHAYSTSREPGAHEVAFYMILEYVQGKTLDELGVNFKKGTPEHLRNSINSQLADVYIQLSRLKFPAIGRLVPLLNGSVRVGRAPFSTAMNQYQLEVGGVPDMIENASKLFERSRANCENEADARRRLYFLHQFSDLVRTGWIQSDLDSGPFVLAHGGLQRWNMLFSDDFKLLAVIDWEWAQTVPLQLFLPPLFLSGSSIWSLGYFYERCADRLRGFCSVVKKAEKVKHGGEAPFSRLWRNLSQNGGILISMALQYPPNIEDAMYGHLNIMLHARISTRDDRIRQFIDQDPGRRDLVARKVATWNLYDAEMKRLGVVKP